MKTEKVTIAEAARIALLAIGKPSTIPEIYEKILALNLYQFNTPAPQHVLRTEIRRKTAGVERIDASREMWFSVADGEMYDIMKEPLRKRAAVGMKRVQRASDKKRIIELLTSESMGGFREIWRVLIFAAVLGFKYGRREPLGDVESGEAIRQDSFANNPVWPGILYLMSLVATNGTEVLKANEDAEDERISLFEEYANGGLAILQEEFESGEEGIGDLISFIETHTSQQQSGSPNLEISI